jgi:hypothetical protein
LFGLHNFVIILLSKIQQINSKIGGYMRLISGSKRVLSKLLIASAFVTIIAVNPVSAKAEVSLRDIGSSSDYAKASIISLAQSNIISGDENGYFHPYNTIKRSEMIKIIVNALGLDTENLPETPTFTDVPKDHWAFKYVEAGYRAGIVKGVTSSLFGVDRECTREEMAQRHQFPAFLREALPYTAPKGSPQQ